METKLVTRVLYTHHDTPIKSVQNLRGRSSLHQRALAVHFRPFELRRFLTQLSTRRYC